MNAWSRELKRHAHIFRNFSQLRQAPEDSRHRRAHCMLLLRQALPADQRPLAHWQSALETANCDEGGGGKGAML